jgi:hypothetical protein
MLQHILTAEDYTILILEGKPQKFAYSVTQAMHNFYGALYLLNT